MEEKEKPTEQANENITISRREFLKDAGLVVGGAAAGAVITYAAGPTKEVAKEVPKTSPAAAPAVAPAPAAGPVTPGTGPAGEPEQTFVKCSNNTAVCVDVKNGRVIRMRPLHYDSKVPGLKPATLVARGKTYTAPNKSLPAPHNLAYRKRIDAPDKALYPLQRVDWEPGGDPAKTNTKNRGKSKFKRITWDKAAQIVSSELTRVAEKYGPEAVATYSSSMGESHTLGGDKGTHEKFVDWWFYSKYGRFPSTIHGDTSSFMGGAWGGVHVWGFWINGYEEGGDLLADIAENTQMFLVWPGDMVSNNWQNSTLQRSICRWMKNELGIKFVSISTAMNLGQGTLSDKWIPIKPGTDSAMQLAIAYTWIKEDTWKKDYVATHSVGFDKWRAYVMGDEDGVPKTPAWASPICGVPEWTIKAVAREYASKVTSIMHASQGGGVCRGYATHEPSRMEDLLLVMQGWGRPGVRQVRGGAFNIPGSGSPKITVGANDVIDAAMTKDLSAEKIAAADEARQLFPRTISYAAIENPPVYFWKRLEQDTKFVYPMPGKPEVRMFWKGGASWLGLHDGNRRFKALKNPKIETIIVSANFIEEAPVYADLILPAACNGEMDDIQSQSSDSAITLYLGPKAVQPRGEAKTDFGICLAVAQKLGFKKFTDLLEGKTEAQWATDQMKKGYEASGWKDKVSWDDLLKNGYFSIEKPAGWEKKVAPGLARKFYDDPKANGLGTPTKLVEFESTFLKKAFPDDKERLPVPHYIHGGGPKSEGWLYDENPYGERAKKYPLLMTANVPAYAYHSQHGDIPWTREFTKQIGWDGYNYENLWMHPTDAAKRGIKHGDIVRIYNERGGVLGAAYVTERQVPGGVGMVKARQCDYIIPDELSRAGSPNSLAPDDGCSTHTNLSGCQNNYLVEVEKVSGAQMDEWRKNYPAAFARDYDPDYGPLASGWIEGGPLT